MVKIALLKIWRLFPGWLQHAASRVIQPLFQVFAAAVIFNERGQILLVRLTYQRFHPWGLPGGSLDYSEKPEDAVVREMFEETGLKIEIEKLLVARTWKPDHVGFYYLCRIVDGEFRPSEEVAEIGYFSKDALPDVRRMDVDLIQQIFEMANGNELA